MWRVWKKFKKRSVLTIILIIIVGALLYYIIFKSDLNPMRFMQIRAVILQENLNNVSLVSSGKSASMLSGEITIGDIDEDSSESAYSPREKSIRVSKLSMMRIISSNSASVTGFEDSEDSQVISLSDSSKDTLFDKSERYSCDKDKNIFIPSDRICPKSHVVTVQMLGRLGNIMWEYAALWVYARHYNYAPYISQCILNKLKYSFEALSIPPFGYLQGCDLSSTETSTRTDITDQIVMNGGTVTVLRQTNVEDYEQLALILVNYLKEIRHELRFKDEIVKRSRSELEDIATGIMKKKNGTRNVTTIGVHVRRGDYKVYLQNRHQIKPAPTSYYLRAMDHFRARYVAVVFVVISDDAEWCSANLRADDVFVVPAGHSAGHDMALMSECDHSIVDYGTYGDWAALLAGGETVAYNLTVGITYRLAQLMPNWTIMS